MNKEQQDELFEAEKSLLRFKMDVTRLEYKYWQKKLEELEDKS